MFPVNQQNIAFLSLSNDTTNNINDLETSDSSMNGFENLFSAYVSSAQDENIAGLDNTALPLAIPLNSREHADGLSISSQLTNIELAETVTEADTSLMANITGRVVDESVTSSNIQLDSTNEQSPIINVSLASNIHSESPVSLVEVEENNNTNLYRTAEPSQLPAATTHADLEDTISVNPNIITRSENLRNANGQLNPDLNNVKHEHSDPSVLRSQSVAQQSNTISSTISTEQESISQTPLSDAQGNDNNLPRVNNQVENNASKYQTDNDVSLPVNQNQVTSPLAQVIDPRLINSLKNDLTTGHESGVLPSFPNQSNITRSTQALSRTEGANITSETSVNRAELINLEAIEVDPVKNSNTRVDNINSQVFTSLDNVIEKQTFDLSSANGNSDNVLEAKNIAGLHNSLQNEHNTQLTSKQTLLDLNKVSVLSNTVSVTDNAVDITNSADIAKQLVLAHQNGTQQIRLSITPEHLGAVDINIQDANDGVSIQIVTQNIVAKESLEMFIPRLREMLEQNGVELQDATIEYKQQDNDNSYGKSDQRASHSEGSDIAEQDESDLRGKNSLTTRVSLSDHMLDAFA